MIKIWAKLETNHRLGKNIIYESLDKYDPAKLYLHIAELCHTLDIPTPVVLKSHVMNFDKFNSTAFTARDFVESIDFDRLILEHVIEKQCFDTFFIFLL